MDYKPHNDLTNGILFTDFYELTMAQLYFNEGIQNKKVRFDYFFRNYPEYGEHKSGYCINAGLEWLCGWLENVRFEEKHIEKLKVLKTSKGQDLFSKDFLMWLKEDFDFGSLDIKAVPEGRVVHPNVPLMVVEGPLAVVQILESSLLNHLNFQTLIASKAARIKDAAKGQLVLEFGLRRAQHTGANAGVRAALIGGADFSSNTGMSCALGFPPKGTHAHSMVQVFMGMGLSELDAFRAYAKSYPDNCLLLVDTIDTLRSGVPNAIKVFKSLRKKGHQPLGIRLDSGDLAYLAIHAAKKLNDEGFEAPKIVLSNQLDEMVIWQIITQIRKEAPGIGLEPDELVKRLVYGVGTRLITSKAAPAMDGVFKSVGIKEKGQWRPAIKLSESAGKIVNPGRKDVWRIYDKKNKAVCDLITLEGEDPCAYDQLDLYHPLKIGVKRVLRKEDFCQMEKLLVDIYKDNERVYSFPSIEEIREARKKDLDRLYDGVKRIIMPHKYHVSLSRKLWETKEELMSFLKKT